MNERIEELIEKSGAGDVVPKGMHNYLKKFAELIVKECANALSKEQRYYSNPGSYETIDYYRRMEAKADAFEDAVDIVSNILK